MAAPNAAAEFAASKEDVEKLASAVRGYHTETTTKLDNIKAEFEKYCEDKVRAVLGEKYEEFKRVETELREELKKIDRSGAPLAVRAVIATADDRKRSVYTSIGAHAIRAWCAALPPEEAALPDQVRAQLGLTENKGGVTIPEKVDEDWAFVMLDHSVARQLLPPTRQIPLDDSLTVVWPTITSRPTASQGTESNNGGATDATFATKASSSATAALIKGHTSFSKVVPARQLALMMTIIGEMLAEDIGHKEDEWFFNSSSPFTGMLQAATGKNGNVVATGASNVEALDSINAHSFFAKMKRSIEPNHIGNGVFVFSPEVWGIVEGLTDTQNRPLYGTGLMGSTPAQFPAPVSVPSELRLINRPVYLTSALPGADATSGSKFCLYMDPRAAAIASRPREVTIDDHVEAKELNRVIIQYELFAVKALLPTCIVAGVLD